MDDFIFRGRDIAEFSAVAAFGAAMKTGAKITRGEYSLPGGGSVIIGGETYAATQRQVVIMPADGVSADAAWAREILAWLMAGRGELVVHNDPDVVRIAQFDSEATYGTGSWTEGALTLNMPLQPLAYDATPTTVGADTEGGAVSLTVRAGGEMELPLRVHIRAKGGTITGATIVSGGQTVRLAGLSVPAGQKIIYDAGQILGDVMTLTAAGAAAWASVKTWARLAARSGEKVTVAVTGAEATVSVTVRGRYPA